ILLPNAIELDDAPGFERFFFITSTTPIDVPALLTTAEKLAATAVEARYDELPLPQNMNQYSVIINKENKGDPE
ncbi:MAG: ActD protein, partial [bacterium]|nr:ActD protein [bacterium]